jgi:hypothetical protein
MRTSLALLLALTLLTGCKKEPVSPCLDGSSKTTAAFKTMDFIFGGSRGAPYKSFEADTFLVPKNILFEATDSTNTTYSWKIGTDQRTFTKKKFELLFDKAFGTIDVTLTATRSDDNRCSSSDLGRDSVSKKIYLRRG